MKYLKPLMLVIAGFAIAMLVSFKNEEPKKEYATVFNFNGETTAVFPDGSEKRIEYKTINYPREVTKLLNELAKEGWCIKSTTSANVVFANVIYLERTKQ